MEQVRYIRFFLRLHLQLILKNQFVSMVKISPKKVKFKCETREALTKPLLMALQI